MRFSVTAVVVFALSAGACGSGTSGRDGPLGGPWRAVVDTVGDTVVVRTLRGSEWGRARLVEELRIGVVEGAEHEMFGRIGALAVTPEGHVLIYDAQAMALRRFDREGAYLGTIGGAGSGPGEYRNVAGLAVLDDGRIVVNDFGNGRFNVYAPGGDLLDTWNVRPAIAEMRPLHVAPRGGVFLHDLRLGHGPDARDEQEVLVRLSGEGVPGDTVPIPSLDYRPPALELRTDRRRAGMIVPFSAKQGWSVTPDGEIVTMIGDRYAVHVHRPDGSVLRIARAVEPVAVTAEERAAEEARVTRFFQRIAEGWRWDGPEIPSTKPPISWVHTGRDGTIWVRVAQPGSAVPEEERASGARTFVREPVVFDVLQTDGHYLGQVRGPDGLRLDPYPVLGHDHVWAVVEGANDVQFVVRFRIERD